MRAHRHGLQATGAKTVDGGGGDADRQARADHRLPRDIAAGDIFRIAAAPDAVFDQRRVYPCALDGLCCDVPAQRCAMGDVEAAAPGLADGRAGDGNDNGI